MNKKYLLLTCLVLLSFALFYLSPLNGLAESGDQSQEIVIELNDDFFNPNALTIPHGKTTILVLQNKGVKDHTFTVRGLAIDVELKPGEEEMLSVLPEQPGTHKLICRFHEQQGMVGEVVVE